MSFKIKGKIDFSDIQKIIHHQQTYTIRNVKEYPSDRRKIISDVNMNLHKGMVNTWVNYTMFSY